MGLDTVELVMKVEKFFAISIADEEAEKIVTVQDFYDTIGRHLSATPSQMPVIRSQVNEIIADHAGLDVSAIQPGMSITNDLGLD